MGDLIDDDGAMDPLKRRRMELECDLLAEKLVSERRQNDRIKAQSSELGEFYLVGDVTEGSVHFLMDQIDGYLRRNPDAEQIRLYINSGGGHVLDGLALVDYLLLIRKRGIHVRGTALGLCASMASVILQATSERTMTPRCWIGLHEVQSVAAGGMSVAQDRLKWAKQMQEQAVALYCERSDFTPETIEDMWARRDVMMGATDALAHGLIDAIEEV